ncbi:AMP-binding protein [Nonomuraea sp. NPDC005650]|uniref:class I adenylate-forming enzyme family protein n=1 Tax=Nonomuraea sp. NPDC005650 TaxID=3157045 RepID=UPI0033A8F690
MFVSREGRYTTTLNAIRERAEHLAGGLRALGVKAGDKVSTQFPLCEEAIVAQFATLMLGAVLVPVVPVFGSRELTRLFEDAKPVAHLTCRRWRKLDYATSLAEIPSRLRPGIVVTSGGAGDGVIAWEDVEAAPKLESWAPADDDETSLIVFTSGSTGVPKGARHTRRTMLAEAFDVGYRLPVRDEELLYLYTSGAGHIAGYVYPLRVLARGMRCIVLDGWDAPLSARIVDQDKPTVMAGLPFHLISMLDIADEEGLDLSSLLMATIGGAPVAAGLVIRAQRAGVPIVKSYGLTELPTAVLGDVNAPIEIRSTYIGRPSGGNEVRIADDDGNILPPGCRGEIQLRGPEMFAGYTNVPDSQIFTQDGWFPTGDIGELSADGLLSIVDRKKNIIIRGGENLSATEIEEIVGTHPSVAEAAVVGIPDDRYGERACAFVVLNKGRTLTLGELLEHFIAAGVSKQKVPEYLEFIDELPRTATGKLRKHDLLPPAA